MMPNQMKKSPTGKTVSLSCSISMTAKGLWSDGTMSFWMSSLPCSDHLRVPVSTSLFHQSILSPIAWLSQCIMSCARVY